MTSPSVRKRPAHCPGADLLGRDQPVYTAKSGEHQPGRPILKLRLGEARHG